MATRSIAPDIPEIHIISIVDPIVDQGKSLSEARIFASTNPQWQQIVH